MTTLAYSGRSLASEVPATQSRNASLDGIRGIAVLAVVLFHATMTLGHHWWPVQQLLKLTQAGWLGVDIFFALSGYLITGILLDAKVRKPVLSAYLSWFYYRRALRIFPLYFGVLILLLLIPQLFPMLQDENYRRFVDMQLWFWLHAANVPREIHGAATPVLEFGKFELTHFWSLAVEEHYYLVWPLVVFFLSRSALLLSAFAIAALSIALKLQLLDLPAALIATPKQLSGLAIGSAAAIYPQLFGRRTLAGATSVFCILLFSFDVTQQTAWLFSPLIALLVACLCIDVKAPSSSFAKILSSRLLVLFGKYSYGIYVYHYLFAPSFRGLRLENFPGGYSVGALAYVGLYLSLPLAVAMLSFNYFEAPFLRLKDKA
jgi:peptidoglycan/LPS O-acetylase OafA/YrhL